jgi:hypothetical protein
MVLVRAEDVATVPATVSKGTSRAQWVHEQSGTGKVGRSRGERKPESDRNPSELPLLGAGDIMLFDYPPPRCSSTRLSIFLADDQKCHYLPLKWLVRCVLCLR